MDQSKLGSLFEVLLNTALGAGIGLLSQLVVFPLNDVHVALHQNLSILAYFTAISVARGYLVRRFANHSIRSAAGWLARLFR